MSISPPLNYTDARANTKKPLDLEASDEQVNKEKVGTVHPQRRAITKANLSSANNINGQNGTTNHNQWSRSFSLPSQTNSHNYNGAQGLIYPPQGYNGYPSSSQMVPPVHMPSASGTKMKYNPTPYQVFSQAAYSQHPQGSGTQPQVTTGAGNVGGIRYIRPALSPETGGDELQFSFRPTADKSNSSKDEAGPQATDLATEFANELTIGAPKSIWGASNVAANEPVAADFDDSDSDEEEALSHPNKYPVEIEYHENKCCMYKRQPTRSGLKVKHLKSNVYDPMTSETKNQIQQIKYYQKDLVRICRCGNYTQMDGALVHGRSNDCDGYEIHYSQKCKWKAYDDFKTGKRVLIRLCKCYKPMV